MKDSLGSKYPRISLKALHKHTDALLVNKDALDDAAANQPNSFYVVAERDAECTSIRDSAKKQLDEVEAEVSRFIRSKKRLENKKEKAPTEKSIYELVIKDSKYQEAFEEYLQLKERTAKWGALKSAYEQRASMLKVLAGLYSSEYFSTDSLRGNKDLTEVKYSRDRIKLKKARQSKGD